MRNGRRYVVVKDNSKRSRMSFILAVVSAIGLAFSVIASLIEGGEGSSYIGAVGLGCALLALYGCIIGIEDLSAEKRMHGRLQVGVIASGIMFIIWIMIFLAGIKG